MARSSGRAKPLAAKAGVTKNRKRTTLPDDGDAVLFFKGKTECFPMYGFYDLISNSSFMSISSPCVS
jgi:hypothetical protein